jgi:arylsulfatase A-like enzyme
LAHTPVAHKRWGGILLELGSPATRPLLGEGWSHTETAADGNTFRWALDTRASFRFDSDEGGKRLAWIECEPFSYPGAPTQVLRININGQSLPSLRLREGRHRYPIEVPLVEGANEVEIGFAHFDRPQERDPSSQDRRRLAAAFYRFEIPPPDAPLVAGMPGPFSLVEPEDGPRGVYLPKNSAISYYLKVPSEAHLVVQAGARRSEMLLARAGSRLDVRVRSGIGSDLRASSKASDPRGELMQVEIPLDALEGSLAEITIRAESDSLFVSPRLHARAPTPVPASATIDRADLNCLVVVLDGATALRMGFSGYSRDTTPIIDRLAGESIVFDNAVSQAVYTIASIGSVLTSQYPERHHTISFADQLPASAVTFPGILSEAGIRTVGISGNAVMSPAFGLGHGFSEFIEVRELEGYTGHGDSVLRSLVGWLESNQGHRFMAYVHFREPHFPFNPPAPFDSQFGPSDVFPEGVTDYSVVEAYNRAAGQGEEVAPSVIGRIRDLYDGNMAYVDGLVGQTLDRLVKLGIDEKTVVILTADHGEALFEHEYIGHNTQLYEESTRVPLIVRWPGETPRRIEDVVELLDIAPTVLDAMGLGGHPARQDMQGRSLVPLFKERGASERLAFSRTVWVKPRYSVRGFRYKLIWDSRTGAGELYDLQVDPGEKNNRYGEEPLVAGYLSQELYRWLREQQRLRGDAPAPDSSLISEEQMRQIEALGYGEYVKEKKKK